MLRFKLRNRTPGWSAIQNVKDSGPECCEVSDTWRLIGAVRRVQTSTPYRKSGPRVSCRIHACSGASEAVYFAYSSCRTFKSFRNA